MATSKVDFLAGSDLDKLFVLIGGFLDNDKDLNNHIESVANKIISDEQSTEGFQCSKCGKVCKAQRGLTRHFNMKHGAPAASNLSEEELAAKKLRPLHLKAIVKKCADK